MSTNNISLATFVVDVPLRFARRLSSLRSMRTSRHTLFLLSSRQVRSQLHPSQSRARPLRSPLFPAHGCIKLVPHVARRVHDLLRFESMTPQCDFFGIPPITRSEDLSSQCNREATHFYLMDKENGDPYISICRCDQHSFPITDGDVWIPVCLNEYIVHGVMMQ
jgi:hypothetical protein